MAASRQFDLVLCSTSSYRRRLLQRLGIPFRVRAPRCDESALDRRGLAAREVAERLALLKADSLRGEEPEAVLIGSDQLVSLDGEILGKPGGHENAARQLAAMAGREHELITALVVRRGEELHRHTDVTRLRMRDLSAREIESYLLADTPYDCAGSYKLEERGITLFERIDSEDHTAITGLPLIALTTILRSLGVGILECAVEDSREELLADLERHLATRARRELARPGRAAVLVPLVCDGERLNFLLTRRTHEVATHKGQVAFPGGFAEAGDEGPIDTALREAEEEIGIAREDVRILGLLDDFPTHDGEVSVTPVVGVLEGRPALSPQRSEVARIFEIPLRALCRREGWRVRRGIRHGRSYPIFYFDHDGETLWGLSAYIVLHLLEESRAGAPYRVPGFADGL